MRLTFAGDGKPSIAVFVFPALSSRVECYVANKALFRRCDGGPAIGHGVLETELAVGRFRCYAVSNHLFREAGEHFQFQPDTFALLQSDRGIQFYCRPTSVSFPNDPYRKCWFEYKL